MTSEIPAWEPFDPSSDGLPESLLALLPGGERSGGVVVSAVSPAAEDTDWPAQASVRLAEAFGGETGRSLLVDLGLEQPTLHEALGTSPADGISDVFLFSASLQHVARAVREGAFLFAPAGTVVGDPAAVLGHDGWEALLKRYVDTGTTVILHVPLAADGAEALISRADAVVLMAGRSESPTGLTAGFAGPIAWVGPPTDDEAGALPGALDPVDDAAVEPGEAPAEDEAGALLGALDAVDDAAVEPDDAPTEDEAGALLGAPDAVDDAAVEPDDAPTEDEAGALLGAPDPVDDAAEPTTDLGDVATLEVLLSEELASGADPDVGSSAEIAGAEPSSDDGVGSPEAADDPASDPPEHPGEDPVGHGADSLPAAEFEGLPTVTDPVPEKGAPVRMLVVLAAVLVFAVVVLLVVFRGSAPSDAAVGPASEAPVTVSAARSATPATAEEASEGSDEGTPSDERTAAGGPTTDAAASPSTDTEEPSDAATAPATDPATDEPAEVARPEAVAAASPTAEAGIMAYGLTINAHERIAAAQDQARTLAARFADLQFILVPVDVSGTLFYRVVAGPARTAGQAEGIRGTMRAQVGEFVAERAIVRSTRWAYLLGAYEDRTEAAERAAAASARGIPAYLAELPVDDGRVVTRVYSGGFASPEEAAALGVLIEQADLLPAPLTERIGRPTR